MSRLVYGVGIYEKGKYTSKIDGKITKEYSLWNSMLQRCYSSNCQLKQTTYIGCSVSEDFKNFQYFAEWCNNQIGFAIKGWHLDKDILHKGNKQYSPTSCVFVPREMNNLILQNNALRGKLPIGVSYSKRRRVYRAQIRDNGTNICLGSFENPEKAFLCYKVNKEVRVKLFAEEYKDRIDPRAYDSLINWSVEMGD